MKKKILIIAASLRIGGAEKVARDIAAYTEEYEFHYVVFGESVGEYEWQLENQGCTVFHIPEPSCSYLGHIRALYKVMKENEYYAVHAHTMFNCGWSMLVGRLSGIPVRVAHAHSALRDGQSVVKSIYEAVMRFLILSCSTDLVACGIKAGRRLFGRCAWKKRGELVLNGIDISNFRYDEKKRGQIRRQLGAADRFILGHAGHLAEVKNQSFLLELMPLILKKRPDALLLMLGEGEDRAMLEQKIRDMGLENNVIMTGNVTNVADYLSAMDVFVFPSLYEGLPLSILEVQANGLPCVISDAVPEDVFLTDLIHPLSLSAPKEIWVDAVFAMPRTEPECYNRQLQDSEYSVEKAMAKIYRIYDKG